MLGDALTVTAFLKVVVASVRATDDVAPEAARDVGLSRDLLEDRPAHVLLGPPVEADLGGRQEGAAVANHRVDAIPRVPIDLRELANSLLEVRPTQGHRFRSRYSSCA